MAVLRDAGDLFDVEQALWNFQGGDPKFGNAIEPPRASGPQILVGIPLRCADEFCSEHVLTRFENTG